MSRIRLFFAGDFCSKPSAQRITVSDELKNMIQSCDLKVVNFEVPLKPGGMQLPPQGRERFYQHDDVPAFLLSLGFNLFSMANNHAFDWGDEGYLKTKAALGEFMFGAGTYDDAYRVKVCEVDGVKIGFMALSFAAYNGVFDDVMDRGGLGCAYINDLRVNHDIMAEKKKVDYLFILPHDGIEYIDVPMPETIARYRDFVDYGADGVIASHPHCPQGWEEYKGKPIFYSLGNFLFNSKEDYDYRATNRPHWYEGLCVVLTIDGGTISWEVVNTRNVDNTKIVIDDDKHRSEHNGYLCDIIRDYTKYQIVLNNQCRLLSRTQELPIIDHSFHNYGLPSTVKSLVGFVFKSMMGKVCADDRELSYLLKNETRRSLLSRHLGETIKYNTENESRN